MSQQKKLFHVDVVVPWVDLTQEAASHLEEDLKADVISKEKEGALEEFELPLEIQWQSNGELIYCLRSIFENLSWIRTVHVVVQNLKDQWPSCLPDQKKLGHRVKVWSHEDIIPERKGQTRKRCWSTHSIEANLFRIPGLSEHFIYMNDDCFICQPMKLEDFFSAELQPIYYFSGKIPQPPIKLDMDNHTMSWINNRRMLKMLLHDFKLNANMHKPIPVAVPMIKSSYAFWANPTYRRPLEKVTYEPFNHPSDIYAIGLCVYYTLLRLKDVKRLKSSEKDCLMCAATDGSKSALMDLYKKINKVNPLRLCIQDAVDPSNKKLREQFRTSLPIFLATKFKKKCYFE